VLSRGFIGLAQLVPGGARPFYRFSLRKPNNFGGAMFVAATRCDRWLGCQHPIYGLAIVDVNQDAVQEFVSCTTSMMRSTPRRNCSGRCSYRSAHKHYNGMFSYFGQKPGAECSELFRNHAQPPYSETHTSALCGPIIKNKTHFSSPRVPEAD